MSSPPITEWFAASYTAVDATPIPGKFTSYDGSQNSVAAVRLTDTTSGTNLIIEGPPEALVKVAIELLSVAQVLVTYTDGHPELHSLYGRV